jgi:hypothetical protein
VNSSKSERFKSKYQSQGMSSKIWGQGNWRFPDLGTVKQKKADRERRALAKEGPE